MRFGRRSLTFLCLAIPCVVAAPANQEIADAVRQLGAADFKTREAATQRLWSAGPAAEPALEQAAQSADPEVATRARKLLADVRSGIRPDTPPAERDLIRRYREAGLEEKQALATRLLADAEPNYDLLATLSRLETNTEQRAQVFGAALMPALVATRETVLRDDVDEVSFGLLVKNVRLWEALLPEDLYLPLEVLPRLEKWGKKAQADALFARALAAQQQACARSPQSADAHNNLAWLCAIARRQLETGRTHAEAAVKLAPKTAAYIDTLAEIEFQLGRPERAVELIKQAVALEPGFPYFKQQLERIQKGDRAVPPPEPDEELDEESGPQAE